LKPSGAPGNTFNMTEKHGVPGSNPGLANYEVPAKRRKIENLQNNSGGF
jgi:hypothetical protein